MCHLVRRRDRKIERERRRERKGVEKIDRSKDGEMLEVEV